MRQIGPVQRSAIQRCRLYIKGASLRTLGMDMEVLSSLKRNRYIVKVRSTNLIDRHTRRHLIEAECTHHIPCRDLAGIVISGQTIWPVRIVGDHHLMYMLLGLPGSAGKIIEIGDLMARLVSLIVVVSLKQEVQFGDEGAWAS